MLVNEWGPVNHWQDAVAPPTGGGGGAFASGVRPKWRPPYDHNKADKDYKNGVIAKIQEDDKEVIELITMLLTKGIM